MADTTPKISIYDADNNNTVSIWAIGTMQAQVPSTIKQILIWNNRGGSTAVSDLRNCKLSVYDENGTTATDDVASEKWVEVNQSVFDGSETVAGNWTRVGGTDGKEICADGCAVGTDDHDTYHAIKGTINGGTTSYTTNFAKINLRVNPPLNSTPGEKKFKVRLTGTYT